MRYDDYSDEELIQMMRDGDSKIADYLCNKYKNLVRSKAKSMYILGAEPEDLIQEGMIGLFKAVRDYDLGRDASFATFADLCIVRQVYNAVQSSNRQKNMPLNSYVSLYEQSGDDGDGNSLIDSLADSFELNPEEVLIDRENVEDLERRILNELSDFERQVFELHLTGMGYVQIAKVLGKDEKSTDNAIQRMRTKIRKIVNSK